MFSTIKYFRCLKLLICFGLFLVSNNLSAQFIIHYLAINPSEKKIVKDLETNLQKTAPARNEGDVQNQIRNSISSLYSDGYLSSNADSILKVDSVFQVWWNIGERYQFATLRTKKVDEGVLSAAGVRDRLYRNKSFSPSRYARLNNSLLNWEANNGYPFAIVKMDSIVIKKNTIDGVLLIDKGPFIVIDTIEIKGNAKLSKIYLLNYLSLKPGEPYDQNLINRISTRIRELPFVSEARPFEIAFLPGLARPVFFLQQKKASQFNGIIGLQPDNTQTGKTYITGDIQLRLHNAFGRAELLDLNWTNPQPRTQDLKIKFSYPFLFNTPLGADIDLTLYKKDSIYLEFNRQLGARYYLSGNNSFKVFVGRKTSNLISTKGYANATTLPSFADVAANTYGIGFQFEKLDYRLNPRQGYSVDFTAGAGIRKITKNSKINEAVYDSVNLKTTQYKGEVHADIYLPIAARSVLNIGTNAAYLQSPTIFENELFRFGGLKSLRGFDESSILASRYIIGKAEYRFILEQNSYLLLFYNLAYYERTGSATFLSDSPYGFGAGLTFETRLGIFSFTYALGSQQNNPIVFRSAKIHFGLINYF